MSGRRRPTSSSSSHPMGSRRKPSPSRLISPGRARARCTSTRRTAPAPTSRPAPAPSAAPGPEGITAELVFIPFAQPAKGEMIFSHRAVAGDYTGQDVAGKIVLTADGGPDGIRRAQERGALAHIHIWPSDEPVIHEMIATSIWGTPTRDSAPRIPRIPALGVTHADGERLREMCE